MNDEEKTKSIQDAMKKLTEARVAVETALEMLAKTVPAPEFTHPPTVTHVLGLVTEVKPIEGLLDQSVCSVPLPIRDYPILPEEYEKLLVLSRDKDDFVLKPKGWLGTDNFAEILKFIQGLGGKYVSAGKASHFRVEGWFRKE
jgi:hypothetical protein